MNVFGTFGRLVALVLLIGSLSVSSVVARQATPEIAPIAAPPVGSYDEVAGDLTAAQERLSAVGRPVIDALLVGDADQIWEELAPEAQAETNEEDLSKIWEALETNRVHFELPDFGVVFDGHFDGETIEGFFLQGITFAFSLERDDPAVSEGIAGAWSGGIEAEGSTLEIEVMFDDSGPDLAATLAIPSQGMPETELDNVAIVEERPIGDVTYAQAMPLSERLGIYLEERTWGDAGLVLAVTIDEDNQIRGIQVEPRWLLPPDQADGNESETSFELPFEGAWWVFWGGTTQTENYHVTTPVQRHATDFVVWKDGGTSQGHGVKNQDYWIWDQAVYAPAGGTVVTVVDGIADNVPGEMNPFEPAGNHVVAVSAPGEFLFLAHFKEGSIVVAEGQVLEQGALVGLVGNSGKSSEAHLHIHLQTSDDLFDPVAYGLPLEFEGYEANGELMERGVPRQGEVVERG